MKNKINLTAIIVSLVVVIAAIFIVSLLKNKEVNTITTQGNYQMFVAPDEAVIYIHIKTEDAISAEIAKNKNSKISDKILTELLKLGLKKEDIQTENYNIYEDYNWINGQQIFRRYIVSNYIKVTTKDFDKVGKIVDLAVDSGAIINYINFELSSEKNNEYKTMALKNATIDAKTKAEAIASGLGKKIKGIISVTTNDYNYSPYRAYSYSEQNSFSEMKEAATNISPKNLEITANVQVTFKL